MKKVLISIATIISFNFTYFSECAEQRLCIPSGCFFIGNEAYNSPKIDGKREKLNAGMFNDTFPMQSARLDYNQGNPCIITSKNVIIPVQTLDMRSLHKLEYTRMHGQSAGKVGAIDNQGNRYCVEGLERGKLGKPLLNTVEIRLATSPSHRTDHNYHNVCLNLDALNYYNVMTWGTDKEKSFCMRTMIFSSEQIEKIETAKGMNTSFYMTTTNPYSGTIKTYHITKIIAKEKNLKKLNKHCCWYLQLEQKKENIDYSDFIVYQNVSIDNYNNANYCVEEEQRFDDIQNIEDIKQVITDIESTGRPIPDTMSFVDHPKKFIYEIKLKEYRDKLIANKLATEENQKKYAEKIASLRQSNQNYILGAFAAGALAFTAFCLSKK